MEEIPLRNHVSNLTESDNAEIGDYTFVQKDDGKWLGYVIHTEHGLKTWSLANNEMGKLVGKYGTIEKTIEELQGYVFVSKESEFEFYNPFTQKPLPPLPDDVDIPTLGIF